MKKWIFLILLSFSFLVYAQWFQKNTNLKTSDEHALAHKKCFCNKRCFSFCKQKGKAVRDCVIRNKTTISLSVDCSCRALKNNEILPVFYQSPNSCLIKPAQAAY